MIRDKEVALKSSSMNLFEDSRLGGGGMSGGEEK
jgi:hypothetical protein